MTVLVTGASGFDVSSFKVNGEQATSPPFTEAGAPSPSDAYGISQWEADQALWETANQTCLDVVVVRPSLV